MTLPSSARRCSSARSLCCAPESASLCSGIFMAAAMGRLYLCAHFFLPRAGGPAQSAARERQYARLTARSLTVRRKAQIPAEEWQYVVLKAIGHRAGVGSVVDLEAVCDSVVVENVMQLPGVETQRVLVADIDADGAVLAEVIDVLVDEGERRVGGPSGENIGLRDAVFRGQVEVQRGILRVGRPCGGGGKLRTREERQVR